ncbi:histone-lysine N-methyltransferase SETDB2-like [Dermochelys coriacea]|uniref:histone-lysine N-methyltransferase SETDB2-like n=1 Tax=Dermochelys coriacea TaxID=27794 RepID=UPI001CA82B8A|nr:histone-lysine N-methyltransferase SETDB2-like [Dermochelys coriacea]
MEEKKTVYTVPVTSEFLDVETLSNVSGNRGEGDAQLFWRQMEDERVDFIFEQVQNVLLSLKQKIKDGTATNEECFQALILVDRADGSNLLALTNVNNVTTEDGMQRSKRRLQPSISNENTSGSPLMEAKEKSHSGNEVVCSETKELPLKLCYQNHDCSNVCLANRPLNSYKGENPLKIPILCHFQRRHAKADLLSKSLDVNYKTPCGRSLRNFQDVQSYLFETECNFLFVDHFSFNTYVQLGRNTLNREALVFDFDISNGAESVPISFCNEVDNTRLPYFKYRKASWPRGYYLNNFSSMFLDSCDCTDGCTDRSKCACLRLTAKGFNENSASPSNRASCGYRYKRLDGPVPSGIYECNLSCKCDRMRCQNRVAKHGIQVRLQVFNTDRKGWGVRCLDDIDKGTFVCTFSGRLMSRAEPQEMRDFDHEAEKKDAVNDRSPSSLSVKRKLDTACSDSEIELVQTGKDSINRRCETLSQPADDEYKPVVVQKYGYNPRNLRSPAIRPKTRTAILQTRRLKLGVATLVHDASSDEDDSSQPQPSTRTKLTTGTKKEKEKPNLQEKLGEQEETMQSEPSITDTAKSKEKRPSPEDARGGKSARLDDAHAMKQSMSLLQRDDFKDKKNRRYTQDPLCNEEAEGDATPLKNSNKENIYLLDATKEGNVGRFLNHSCCPNLFVQSVFVETHNRNFPWVAFFTNRHVKAGTELTWDYGYEAGSMPETEISCQCGVQKCRKKRETGKIRLLRPHEGEESPAPAEAAPARQRPLASSPQPPGRGTATARHASAYSLGGGVRRAAPAAAGATRDSNPPLRTVPGREGRKRAQPRRAPPRPSAAPYRVRQEARATPGSAASAAASEHAQMPGTCSVPGSEPGPSEALPAGHAHFLAPPPPGVSRILPCVEADAAAQAANDSPLPRPRCLSPGDFHIMEKMVKRKCAFCPADEECAIMYIAEKQNLAVHQDCLLYSSGFVESEEHNPENQDTRFDVASVQSEIRRGKRLMCNFCRKKGATVGCEIKTCRRSYHYFCALCDDAALETDGGQGIYRVFCPKHDPGKRTNHYDADNKRNRHGMKSSTFTEKRSTEETAAENSLRLLRKKHNKHKARIDFLRKCKQAGLLDGIFKEMLDTLHLAKEKLMDDNTSETEYEETVISLFDCSLFENILTNVHSGTEEKLQELLETRKRLDTQIELLQDLKEVIPFQENIASASSSVSE